MEIQLSNRELDVMTVLWDLGSATVSEVRERVPDDLAYTTVLTVLRILESKGFAGHEQEGKAYRYHPVVARENVEASAVRRLVSRMFRDSPEVLLTHLVANRSLSRTELERLRQLVDERLEEE